MDVSSYMLPLVASIGGLLALDSVFFLQIQISRPIVVAGVIGAILGDFSGGLWVGVPIELIWIAVLPLGNFIPPDVTLVTVIAVFLSLGGSHQCVLEAKSSAAIALFLSLPFGPFLKMIDMRFRSLASGWTFTLKTAIEEGKYYRTHQVILLSLFLQWAKNTALIVFLIAILFPIHGFMSQSSFLESALVRWLGLLPLLGLVAILKEYRARNHPLIYTAGLLGGVLFLAGKSL